MSARSLQDLMVWQSNVYFLYNNLEAHASHVGAVDSAGNLLWRNKLPKAQYLGMSYSSLDSSLLLHAMGYQGVESSVLKYSPQAGAISSLGKVSPGGALHFAGDSRFGRVTPSGLELWQIARGSLVLLSTLSLGGMTGRLTWTQVLPDGSLAIVSQDGQFVALVPSGALSATVQNIASGDIAGSAQYYRKYNQQPNLNPLIVSGTGSVKSSLALLISPFVQQIARVVVVDPANGQAGSTLQLMLPPLGHLTFAVPSRIISNADETGIVFSNGSVAWYSA